MENLHEVDYSKLPGANKGKKPKVHDKDVQIYDEHDVIAMVYDVAPIIYKKKRKWFYNTNYDLEDFVQDAAIHILERFREDYFDLSNPKLKSVIYTLIDGYFSLNKSRWDLRHSREELHLDAVSDNEIEQEQYVDLLLTKDLDPEEKYILEKAIKDGREITNKMINKLSDTVFQTRKYRYIGEFKGKNYPFSEKSLVLLFLEGLTLKDIQEVYKAELDRNYYKARLVERKLKQTLNKLAEMINALEDSKRFNVKVYLLNIGQKKNAFPDDFLDKNRNHISGEDGSPGYYDTL
jgi:hypothetical protein